MERCDLSAIAAGIRAVQGGSGRTAIAPENLFATFDGAGSASGLTRLRHRQGALRQCWRGHSQYLTFRVMSEDSTGWIRPPQPGKFPAKTAVETYRPIAEQAFKAALQKDVDALLGG